MCNTRKKIKSCICVTHGKMLVCSIWHTWEITMSGRLIVLDKIPGIRPVGIGETWRRLLAKCLLRVSGQEAKAAWDTEQLAGSVEAGIEGAIHAARLQCTQHSQEEDWGFLLIDARNVFNEENRTAMLWAVRNEWPSGGSSCRWTARH